MAALALIISIIALIVAIMAYQRTGGTAELKGQMENLSKAMEVFREKTADLLDKAEAALRRRTPKKKEEEEKEGGK